jgi:transposase
MPGNGLRRDCSWLGILCRLYKWQKAVVVHGGAFPAPRQAEPAAELARLKRELARVTEERDILKKAAIFFARESA